VLAYDRASPNRPRIHHVPISRRELLVATLGAALWSSPLRAAGAADLDGDAAPESPTAFRIPGSFEPVGAV